MQTNNYTYIPKLHRFAPATLSFFLLLVSSLFSYFSLHTPYTFSFTAFGAFFIVMSFQVFFRYCLSEHIYTVSSGGFTVVRKTGKYETVIFDLPLESVNGILPEKEGKHRIKAEKCKTVSRTANLLPKNKYYIFYDDRAVCVEIDSGFVKKIEEYL